MQQINMQLCRGIMIRIMIMHGVCVRVVRAFHCPAGAMALGLEPDLSIMIDQLVRMHTVHCMHREDRSHGSGGIFF